MPSLQDHFGDMVGTKQPDFTETRLNLDLLLSTFKVQTKWQVITGASSSGKTTLIDLFAGQGFQTVPEPGREYIERELSKGRTIGEIRQDRAAMTRQIYNLWLEKMSRLPVAQFSFLDRGLPDSLAFYRFAGMDPNGILPDCFRYRYAAVFMLDRLPYQQDGIRGGDDASAAYFESWMARDYASLGYNLIWVPVLPPEERLTFILDRVDESQIA